MKHNTFQQERSLPITYKGPIGYWAINHQESLLCYSRLANFCASAVSDTGPPPMHTSNRETSESLHGCDHSDVDP